MCSFAGNVILELCLAWRRHKIGAIFIAIINLQLTVVRAELPPTLYMFVNIKYPTGTEVMNVIQFYKA